MEDTSFNDVQPDTLISTLSSPPTLPDAMLMVYLLEALLSYDSSSQGPRSVPAIHRTS